MQIWNSIQEAAQNIVVTNTHSVVTIGNFDGVHRGHQAIIRRVVELAQTTRGLSVVLTFSNHTGSILEGKPPLVNQPAIRRELLSKLGLDATLEVEFNREMAGFSPELFFKEWLMDRLQAKAIVIGHDFKFGAGGRGNYQLLRQLGSAHQIIIEQIPPVLVNGTIISSSQIRQLIRQGNIELANEMLGYSFTITGEVVTGEQRGRNLGFPTANIHLAQEYLLPAYGVYLVAFTTEGRTYYGVASVGVKPTFGEYDPLIEVHLFDLSLDLYHKTAKVEFIKFIRPEVRFNKVDFLREQIMKDIEDAKRLITEDSNHKLNYRG